jgi:hypothetical protein
MWHNFRRFLPSGETGLPTLRDCVAAHVRQGAYRGDFSPTKLLDVRGSILPGWTDRPLHCYPYPPSPTQSALWAFDSVKEKQSRLKGALND